MNASAKSPGRTKWRILLDDARRREALEAVRDIAAALKPSSIQVGEEETANLALFYGYLSQAWPEESEAEMYAECAFDYLNRAIDRASAGLHHDHLCGGYAGLGWVIANLSGKLLASEESENCEAVDDIVIELLRRSQGPLHHELLYGLAGLGVYALERLPHVAGLEILQMVLSRLAESAERCGDGLTWFTPAERLPEWQREICPNGYYNLGLAHGVPGVLPVLARACEVRETRGQAWELLNGAQAWLQSRQMRDGQGTYLVHWLAPEVEPEPGRIAWCYGALGAATAWLDAARCVGRADWQRDALALVRREARKPIAGSGIHDACLCHGTSGNAHIFNRVYQATGEDSFRQAALRWYEHTLALRHQEETGAGLGGFQMWEPKEDGTPGWANRPDFLDGVAGTGLALLAACTDYEPQWDRLLAVSIS
ncbi:MAG TPA: lanthionine synthetase C family protein [Blastocatellia bacterium]|nr:lanthionine synthetase C family protein [Blastocatellia bacterium]HMV82898.1 lanthionine synthetase C family protein [Blastocatellia bacterium]HMY72226.1 lanthionine synthetase C family protein [Blastocatellia bacterium]HMZ23128.1 lanthionine synthetase C family protein [Blastocatellia bacterium]HNG29555.1 lanthionine synthetase C family protein [Blastocatellia bacterium]